MSIRWHSSRGWLNQTLEAVSDGKPEALFAVGAVSQYLGAALAFSLFDDVGVAPVAWLRVGAAAAVLSIAARHRLRRLPREHFGLFVTFGLILGGMNLCFYLAIDRLPLGNAVAVEFLGPVAVAAIGSRSRRSLLVLAVALVGILLIADLSAEGSTLGFLLALSAGALWAGYIVLGSRVAATGHGRDGLTVGLIIGAVALAPLGIIELASNPWPAWYLIAFALGTGVLSNVIPYSIDQVVLTLVTRVRFALLQALLPVTAALVGLIGLGQVPSVRETAGIALVVVAVGIRPSTSESLEPYDTR